MKAPLFNGGATALITPFKEDYSVNYNALTEILEYQIKNRIDAVVVCGTTGEASTLSDAEHLHVIAHTVQTVSGRVPVIAGTGSNDTAHAVMMSREAQAIGADGVLLVTPYYNKTSQAGLIRHYTAIADSIEIPVILYNVPSRTGMTIEPATYQKLSEHPNIAAAKEASGNFTAIASAMALCGDQLVFYSGNDDQIVPLIALGAKGVISVLSNVLPAETSELCADALSGDFDRAARKQLMLLPLINALFSDVNPVPVKEAMNLIGFQAGPCRLPLTALDDARKRTLKEFFNC